jgi:hypothetical protein
MICHLKAFIERVLSRIGAQLLFSASIACPYSHIDDISFMKSKRQTLDFVKINRISDVPFTGDSLEQSLVF